MNVEKQINYDEGKLNRGMLTWAALLIICALIQIKQKGLKWILLTYIGASVLIVVSLYIYHVRQGSKKAFRRSLIKFFSEVGGGF